MGNKLREHSRKHGHLVREIREKWVSGKYSARQLCREYGFNVSGIIYNEAYHDPEYTPPSSQGRKSQKGESSKTAKLTEEQVRQIRTLRSSGADLRILAAQFRVSESTISAICSGKRWAHIGV